MRVWGCMPVWRSICSKLIQKSLINIFRVWKVRNSYYQLPPGRRRCIERALSTNPRCLKRKRGFLWWKALVQLRIDGQKERSWQESVLQLNQNKLFKNRLFENASSLEGKERSNTSQKKLGDQSERRDFSSGADPHLNSTRRKTHP